MWGKTVTISLLYSDGTIDSASGTFPSSTPSSNTNVATTEDENGGVTLRLFTSNKCDVRLVVKSNKSITIRAVKLELGSVSTLAMDTTPNYATELLKCQRYYHIYATESLRPSNMFDCVPVMASTPSQGTITIDSTTYYYNSADL